VEQKEKEMGEEIKDVNKKIDEMDAAVKKYASKDTVIAMASDTPASDTSASDASGGE
jgi:hypothetical protein